MDYDFVREDEDHSECLWSTGIHEGLTVGQGKLDDHGYWERPCGYCARKHEEEYSGCEEVWPFAAEEEDE